jgi:acetyl-CoA carboxylase carboxyltransferase component
MSQGEERYHAERARIEQGHAKYRDKLRAEGKMFVRDRLKLLLDPGTEFQEDWLFARNQESETPADGVVTGVGRVGGKTVCIMANDYTVKAGSWGETPSRSRSFRGVFTPAASSTTRSSSRAWCRRSASSLDRHRRAPHICRR